MSNLAVRLQPETIRSLAAGSVVAGYTAIGTAIDHPGRILVINNLTDGDLMFSFDGTNDHMAIAGPGSFVLDITANNGIAGGLFIAQGTTIYVKRIDTPTTGSVYVSVFYGNNSYNT